MKKSKKQVCLELLETTSVFIHLDPRKSGVVVPHQFFNNYKLVLQIGLRMAIPIKDLAIEDDGITCTLSFGGRGSYCVLPWESIYALIGEAGGGWAWPEDVPAEVKTENERLAKESSGAKPAVNKPPVEKPIGRKSVPYLRLVK